MKFLDYSKTAQLHDIKKFAYVTQKQSFSYATNFSNLHGNILNR